MKPLSLWLEETVCGSGAGPSIALGAARGKPLQVTLTISRMMEQQTLEVQLWGSVDASDWGKRPLVILPRRHYCGIYPQVVDLTESPSLAYLRVTWTLSSWNPTTKSLLATFSVTAQPVAARVYAAAMA